MGVPPRPERSASSDRNRPASLISAPAAVSPALASKALACPAAVSPVLASPVAAFQAPYPCVSPPHDGPTFFSPFHHGLRVSRAPGIRDTVLVLIPRFTSPERMHNRFHPSRRMAAYGFVLVAQGVGEAAMATARARGDRAPPEISEGTPNSRREARLSGGAGGRAS